MKEKGKWTWFRSGNVNLLKEVVWRYANSILGKYVGEIDDGVLFRPSRNESVPQGTGTLTIPQLYGEIKYDGEWKDGKKHGKGTETSWGGSRYEGMWRNNEEHGFGEMTYSDSDSREEYKGYWKDGEYHGQGTFTDPVEGKYEGYWKNGKKHGQGNLSFPDGTKTVGEFREDKLWNGNLYDKNGNIHAKYENGKWKALKGALYRRKVKGKGGWFKKGTGDEDEGIYIGDGFEAGKPNGQGTLTFPEGIKYVGEFKDGKYHGQGTIILEDGEKYEGKFKNWKFHGQGTFTESDGRKLVGVFKEGSVWNVTEYDEDGNIDVKYMKGESKFVGVKEGVLFRKISRGDSTGYRGEWYEVGNEKKDEKYVGEIKNGRPHGRGKIIYPGKKERDTKWIFRDGEQTIQLG